VVVTVLAIIHAETPTHDQKHLVFNFVVVPGERTLELYQLQMLAIQLANDPWVPVIVDEGKLFGEIDLVHIWRRSPIGPMRHRTHGMYANPNSPAPSATT